MARKKTEKKKGKGIDFVLTEITVQASKPELPAATPEDGGNVGGFDQIEAGGPYMSNDVPGALLFQKADELIQHVRVRTQHSGELFGMTLGLLSGALPPSPTEFFPQGALDEYLRQNTETRLDLAKLNERCPDSVGKDYQRVLQGWYGNEIRYGLDACRRAIESDKATKRAVITIGRAGDPAGPAGQWKCMRELVFSVKNGYLNCHAFARAQAVEVMPKNLFVNRGVQAELARMTGLKVGWYLHTMARVFYGSQDKK